MPDDVVRIAIEAVDNASSTFEKVGDELDKLGKSGEDAGAGAAKGAQGFESFAGKLVAVQAGVGIAKEALQGLQQVWDFAKQGAENQRIAESFQRTAKSIGANADDIVAKLDEAARGTVDDEELMQASTRALTLGVAKSGADLVNVMKLARAASLQFGGDAGQAFESINQAIGNLAPRALKQFGIIVSLKDANEAYAKSIGVAVDALTEEQQRQALLNAVLEQGAKTFKDVGDAATTTAEKMKAVETRLGNILDIAKETAATGLSTAFEISDAPKNAMEAFIGTAQKMRKEVAEGRMSVKDYNDGLRGMANAMSPLLSGAIREAAFNELKLNESFDVAIRGAYSLTSALDESARAAQRSADAQAAEAVRQNQAKDAAARHTEVMRAYSNQLLANVQRYKDTQINLADTTALAITYTEAQQKQADVQAKLDELNAKIASHGPARTAVIQNEKLSTDDLAKAKLSLAVAQEDLVTVQRKGGETDAEFALRVETIKGKIADYSQKLGEHTAIVGGATKAEQEQKKALEEQIATLQKAEEVTRAKSAFDALNATFKAGAITEDQYRERATALNQVAGLYTESAFKQATAQEILLKAFADPRSEAWKMQLYANKDALDGVSDAAQVATDKANALASSETLSKQTEMAEKYRLALEKIPAEITTRVTIEDKTKAVAGDSAEERRKQLQVGEATAKTIGDSSKKTIDAVADIASKSTDKVTGVTVDASKKLSDLATTTQTKFASVSSSVVASMTTMGTVSSGQISTVALMIDRLPTYKELVYQITVKGAGNIPEGLASGGSLIVPPNPGGGSGDYFPVLAAPGERVTVQTRAQQNSGAQYSGGGDTYNYTTNVYNPLAAAMLADKQRRERLARSNARMGVTQ